jgi:hypothetical protein
MLCCDPGAARDVGAIAWHQLVLYFVSISLKDVQRTYLPCRASDSKSI